MVWTGTNLMMRIFVSFSLFTEMFSRERRFAEARTSDLTWHERRAHKVFSSLLCSCAPARVRARKKE